MVVRSRVVDLGDELVLSQVGRDGDGVLLGSVYPQGHGLQPAQRQETVEGRQTGPLGVLHEVQSFI